MESIICPLTKQIFNQPVCATDGYTYESQAINQWLRNNTMGPHKIWISKNKLTINHTIIQTVNQYLTENPDQICNKYKLSTKHEDNEIEINIIIEQNLYDELLKYDNFNASIWIQNNTIIDILKLAPVNIIKHLILNNIVENDKLMMYIIKYSTSDIIKYIINIHNCDIHIKMLNILIDRKLHDIFIYLIDTHFTRTLLFFIVKQNMKSVIEHAINQGSYLNDQDNIGNTVIYYILKYHPNDLDLIKKLIINKINLNVANNQSMNPIHYAIKYASIDVIKYLLINGANMEAIDKNGLRPIHIAIQIKSLDKVKYLTELGVDLKCTDIGGLHPIHYALEKNIDDMRIANYLIDECSNYCDLECMDNYKQRPIHYAIGYQHNAIAHKLIDKNVDLNAKTHINRSPIYFAIAQQQYDLARILIDKGVDLECDTNTKPLDIALHMMSDDNKQLIQLIKYLIPKVNTSHIKVLRDHVNHMQLYYPYYDYDIINKKYDEKYFSIWSYIFSPHHDIFKMIYVKNGGVLSTCIIL